MFLKFRSLLPSLGGLQEDSKSCKVREKFKRKERKGSMAQSCMGESYYSEAFVSCVVNYIGSASSVG